MIDWAKATGRRLTVRLVKRPIGITDHPCRRDGLVGSRLESQQDSDACFERMAWQFLQSTPRSTDEGGIKLALGSHTARSRSHWLPGAPEPPESALAMLLAWPANSRPQGRRRTDCEYVPVGEMIPAWATWCGGCWKTLPTNHGCWPPVRKPDPNKLLASPHVTHTQPDPGEALLMMPERHL